MPNTEPTGFTRLEALALALAGLCDMLEWLLYALMGHDMLGGMPLSLRIHGWVMNRVEARAQLEKEASTCSR